MAYNTRLILTTLSFIGYFLLSFFVARHEHLPLFTIYAFLFIIYVIQLVKLDNFRTQEIFNLAIILRIVFLISFPALSDDFYRFIWDGRVLGAGQNPFEHLPAEFLAMNVAPNINGDLFYKLNSPEYYTVYPPIAQFTFLTATSIFPESIYGSMMTMKVIVFLGEIALMLVMMRILMKLNISRRYVAIYALNPLVIIEVVGNIHHEGLMLLFLLISIYLLMKHKYVGSALMWGISIATKLMPLMYLPLLLFEVGKRHIIKYYLIVGAVVLLLFIPLIEGLLAGMGESISLYFQKFEFNASIYFIVRELGFWARGYNVIQTAGPALGLVVFMLIMIFSATLARNIDIFKSITWVFMIYLVFSTTVHPWYIVSLLCFSVFTGYIFPVVWSFFIFLTYAGYSDSGYQEQYYITTLEYVCTFAVMAYEIVKKEDVSIIYKLGLKGPGYQKSSNG